MDRREFGMTLAAGVGGLVLPGEIEDDGDIIINPRALFKTDVLGLDQLGENRTCMGRLIEKVTNEQGKITDLRITGEYFVEEDPLFTYKGERIWRAPDVESARNFSSAKPKEKVFYFPKDGDGNLIPNHVAIIVDGNEGLVKINWDNV